MKLLQIVITHKEINDLNSFFLSSIFFGGKIFFVLLGEFWSTFVRLFKCIIPYFKNYGTEFDETMKGSF